jgi:hypothetical protein
VTDGYDQPQPINGRRLEAIEKRLESIERSIAEFARWRMDHETLAARHQALCEGHMNREREAQATLRGVTEALHHIEEKQAGISGGMRVLLVVASSSFAGAALFAALRWIVSK